MGIRKEDEPEGSSSIFKIELHSTQSSFDAEKPKALENKIDEIKILTPILKEIGTLDREIATAKEHGLKSLNTT